MSKSPAVAGRTRGTEPGTRWTLTAEDKRRYAELKAEGKNFAQIAKAMRRPFSHLSRLNLDWLNKSSGLGQATTYVDDQGRTITRLPPGYAYGVSPTQVVMPKSGVNAG